MKFLLSFLLELCFSNENKLVKIIKAERPCVKIFLNINLDETITRRKNIIPFQRCSMSSLCVIIETIKEIFLFEILTRVFNQKQNNKIISINTLHLILSRWCSMLKRFMFLSCFTLRKTHAREKSTFAHVLNCYLNLITLRFLRIAKKNLLIVCLSRTQHVLGKTFKIITEMLFILFLKKV